jgi:hypothetical protein
MSHCIMRDRTKFDDVRILECKGKAVLVESPLDHSGGCRSKDKQTELKVGLKTAYLQDSNKYCYSYSKRRNIKENNFIFYNILKQSEI